MSEIEIQSSVRKFIEKWTGRGNENQDTALYWIELLTALGVSAPTDLANFEKPVFVGGRKKRIDVYMAETRVLVEQKSLGIDIDKREKQSDGAELTPYEQGKRYSDNLPMSEKPYHIIVCNFEEIRVYDMDKARPEEEPFVIKLEDLESEYKYLEFLTEFSETELRREEQVSIEAGSIIKKLYGLILDRYADKESEKTARDLNILCVRLVFMMYCEDSGIFGKDQFKNYVLQTDAGHLRSYLKELFEVLDTPIESRDPYLGDDLKSFPYVNGGLFREKTEIPQFTDEIVSALTEAMDFDWSSISAPIFGACYESTINPETRHQNGMHYTKTEDVAKLLDNLFLDDLRAELSVIKQEPDRKKKKKALTALQDKISNIGVADFAAGSGNFGVEAYLGLRRIENEIITERNKGQVMLDVSNIDDMDQPIKVSISQIYLAEINDFAADVARVALWIAEAQMLRETESIISKDIEYFPLSTEAHITTCDSLTTDWNDIAPKDKIDYIVQNPPYLGYSLQSKEQKEAIRNVYVDEEGRPYKTAGKIDYVAGWMFKAAEYIQGTDIRCAFVTTNSVTQGEQVANIWKPLYDRFGIHIDFAYQTFKWNNGTKDMAAVHVVIFGFSSVPRGKNLLLYEPQESKDEQNGIASSGKTTNNVTNFKPAIAENINPYLIDAPTIFVESRTKPLSLIPNMVYGNKPTDGGFLFLTPAEKNEILRENKSNEKFIRRVYGASEYINSQERYCLWLVGASPSEIITSKLISERVDLVRKFRLDSTKEATNRSASTPTLFQEIRQPDSEYIIVPRHSSENREYVPIGFFSSDIIVNDAVQIIPDASLYHLGVLTSSMHMGWMRTVAGRLKSDYRYSKDIVYNNFPWPEPTDAQKAEIEKCAQAILDARSNYPDASLADMYGYHMYLYSDLVRAHEANDKAVMAAYGIKPGAPAYTDETARVALLMELYQKLTG